MSGDVVDQIFIRAKQWLLSWLAGAPDWIIQITSSLLNIFALLGVFLTLFALISVLERKILGRMQNRYGPNRVGPFGLFQPIADGIKMLIKEDIVPARADKIVHFLAPILIAATAILALGVIPYGRNMTPFAIDGGILFFFAVGSTTELAVFMAGWGSNNKFSMLGAMRAIAQMVSYELPLIITTLPVVMVAGALSPDVIVTVGSTYTRAAQEATATIPIVMAQDPDPVGNGFVASLARPGGNITGLSALSPELSGKQLELLREIVPKLSRVAVLGNSTEPGNAQALREVELAAKAFGVKLQYLDVLDPKDIETAFRAAAKGRADAVLVLGSAVFNTQRIQFVELAVKSRLPATYSRPEYVEDGGLISYAPSYTDLFRRAATYVDKILKGAKPGDLPVEQPTKFEVIINLKAAKQIGLTIPSNVLASADKVIR